MNNKMEERENIIALKNDSRDAFKHIYLCYWEKVYNFIRLYISDKTEAEDIIHEVFLRLWDSRLLIDENRSLKGYLFVITRNYIFNMSRKHFNREFFELTVLSSYRSDTDIEAEVEANNLSEYIDHILSEQPKQRQTVFKMSRHQHKSYKEIAQSLNITEKTVERHINETLKAIRKNLPLLILFVQFV